MSTERELAEFLERIGEWVNKPGASQRGKHRAAFFALRPLIEGALASGFTMKATWAALRDERKVSMTYETFRAHCRRTGIVARCAALNLPEAAPRGRDGRGSGRSDLN